jgi:hypothetical protein
VLPRGGRLLSEHQGEELGRPSSLTVTQPLMGLQTGAAIWSRDGQLSFLSWSKLGSDIEDQKSGVCAVGIGYRAPAESSRLFSVQAIST